MKLLFLFVFLTFHIAGFSQSPVDRIVCDTALRLKEKSSLEKCFLWLESSQSGVDAQSKAAANMDYAQALQYAGKPVEAEYFLVQATREAILSNDELLIAISSEALARYYYNEKKYNKILLPLQSAIDNYTSKLGRNHTLTINSSALVADVDRLNGNYSDAIEVSTRILQSITEDSLSKLSISAHLYNIRALSNEKLGHTNAALSDYILAAQTMEKIDRSSSLVMWKNVKSFLMDSKLTEDTSAIDKRILFLSEFDMAQNNKQKEQLAPRISLEISNSSVKQQ
jgi:tetratricopeptide (TPR) repeat protein